MKTACVLTVAFCLFALGSTARSQDTDESVFSGPQVGEKLVSFKVQGVLEALAGKEFDLIEKADGGPIAIIFLHELTRPSAAVTRTVMTYAAKFTDEGLVCGVVFLSDDATATTEQIKRASHALPKVPIGISTDGGEGPGAYGLNRKMSLTVLVGKDNKVTANFPLVQPSLQADAPKIGREIARVLGKDISPTLAQMGAEQQYARPAPATGRDPNLDPLLRAVIQKTATKEQVDEAAAAVEEYVAKNAAAKRQVGEIASRIVSSDKLTNYGTETAQHYLQKWAKEYTAKEPPRERSNERKDDKQTRALPSYIMVTEGIVGGFVPAHVRQRTIVVKSSEQYDVFVMKQSGRGDEAVFQQGMMTEMQFAGLVKDLGEGLWKLPVESPAGCEDVYKLDTSIVIRADGQFWRNGGPGGCVHGESKVKPSDGQRQQFQEFVKIIKQIAEKHVTDKGDGKSHAAAVMMIQNDNAKQEKSAASTNAATKF